MYEYIYLTQNLTNSYWKVEFKSQSTIETTSKRCKEVE